MLGLHAPDGAERLCRGIDSCDRAREIVVRKDGAGSGGVVEPGAACWVGISGASGVMGRELQRIEQPVNQCVRVSTIGALVDFSFSPCPFGAEIIYPVQKALPTLGAYWYYYPYTIGL